MISFFSDIFNIHKTHYVIQPTIFDGQNQRKLLTTTRQTVNEFQSHSVITFWLPIEMCVCHPYKHNCIDSIDDSV